MDWFDKKPEPEAPEKDKEKSKPDPRGDGDAEEPDDTIEEVPEDPKDPLVLLIKENDEVLGWGLPPSNDGDESAPPFDLDYSQFPRQPYPHQIEAIRWLTNHSYRAGQPLPRRPDDRSWGAGALLADDMGLGKTLSTLLFLGAWYDVWRKHRGEEPPACLVVAPLSLVENWRDEIKASFHPELVPFRRILAAIPRGDLKRFYVTANGRDQVTPGSGDEGAKVEKYGLRFGDKTEDSLDQPGTCVITTYQTLRDFRFSLAGCEWGATIFDEAQNVKNPNALQTVTAKALKAFFRVALTGTPVENHLGDLWSLMDAVEPGALGSFVEFRDRWIRPLRGDPSQLETIGGKLRTHLGDLVLRRTKEEELKGLPSKSIVPCPIPMPPEQVRLYDEVLDLARNQNEEESAQHRANRWLGCMWELRRITLHPDLLGDAPAKKATKASDSRAYFRRSGKLQWLLDTLDDIKRKGEKVLIFAVQRRLQDMLASHLHEIYKVPIPLINGDTKAIATRDPNSTRLGLIKKFSGQPGFGICVLSPIAAGAGLNIVAANHVIHLERHWNPAKEDQATDRAYRIGQERPVYVHIPLLVHPDRATTTFDLGLDKLIDQKRSLAGSLGFIPVSDVSNDELFGIIYPEDASTPAKPAHPLTLDEACGLSWEHFEALIAECYSHISDRVLLTARGSDGGVDVVVIGHGPESENILVQCKQTGAKSLDSAHAVREVEGARAIFESKLKLEFAVRRVHTNVPKYSKRTREASEICKVPIYGSKWIDSCLKNHKITLADLIKRDASRTKI